MYLEIVAVIAAVMHFVCSERHVAHGEVKEIIRVLGVLEAVHGNVGLLVKLSGDPARQTVQFHAVQVCAGKVFRQKSEKVPDAAGGFQDVSRLKAHPLHSVINGLDNAGLV